MIKVVPYILTMGSDNFKKFLALPFNLNMLCTITDENVNVIFDGWRGKNMGSWFKFTNDDDVVFEIYAEHYNVLKNAKKETKSLRFPLPKTINDFINDMERLEIHLYWSKWIDENFEPKDYLNAEEILKYFTNLFIRMGKFHELN